MAANLSNLFTILIAISAVKLSVVSIILIYAPILKIMSPGRMVTNKLHGLSPRANYTDRATAASRQSGCRLLRIKGATWSA
jgi:hypothetical protein